MFVLSNAKHVSEAHLRPDMKTDQCWWRGEVAGSRGLLTQVQHGGDEAPADDELAALEHLLQTLLALFAQFGHDFTQIRSKIVSGSDAERWRAQEARVCRKVCGGVVPTATVLRQSPKKAPRWHLAATLRHHDKNVQCRKYFYFILWKMRH